MNANILVIFNNLSLSFKFHINHFCEGCKEKSHIINKTFYAKNPFTKYKINHNYDIIMIDIMYFFILFMKNFYFINHNNFCNTLYLLSKQLLLPLFFLPSYCLLLSFSLFQQVILSRL